MATIFDILLNQNLGSSSPSFRSSDVIESTPARRVDFLPELDVTETRDNIIIEMELAGVLKEDIQIEILESKLVIQGEKKRYHYKPQTSFSSQSSQSIGSSYRSRTDSNMCRPDSNLMEKHRPQESESNVQQFQQPRQPMEEMPSSQHKDDIKSRSNISQTSQLFEQQQPISFPSDKSMLSDMTRQSTEQRDPEQSRVEQFNQPSTLMSSNVIETEQPSRFEQVKQPSTEITSGDQSASQIPSSMVSDKIDKFESQKPSMVSSENVQSNEPSSFQRNSDIESQINRDFQRSDQSRNVDVDQQQQQQRSFSPSRRQSEPQIQPHQQEHDREKKYISERSFGHFKRYLDLTKILYRLNVNQISSHYENGLLFVIINKKPFEHSIKIPLD